VGRIKSGIMMKMCVQCLEKIILFKGIAYYHQRSFIFLIYFFNKNLFHIQWCKMWEQIPFSCSVSSDVCVLAIMVGTNPFLLFLLPRILLFVSWQWWGRTHDKITICSYEGYYFPPQHRNFVNSGLKAYFSPFQVP